MDDRCKCIHETVIRDILDVISDVKDSDENLPGFHNKKSFKSIAQASSNLTLVFPVIVSRSMSIEAASMVTKAIERKCVTMLQMLFSAMCISDSDSGMDYVKQFHSNLKIDDTMSVDSFINAMDDLVLSKESCIGLADPELYEKVKEDMHNINFTLPENINETSLEDYEVTSGIRGRHVIKEAKKSKRYNSQHLASDNTDSHDINKHDTNTALVVGNGSNNGNTYNYGGAGKSNRPSLKDRNDYLKNQLLDNDVKKSNELVPTTMVVNFVSTDKEKPVYTQIVIGVKAKMYPVDSTDILNRLTLKHNDKNKLIQFVRSTTREISFVRDFLFAIDRCKLDALSQSNRGSSSKVWKVLERRAVKSKVRRALGQINDASAITSLAITQEEVEYLKKTENIHLDKPATIRPIMESLNFMGVCIVDESSEVANFIFDTGNDIYETLSFKSLEREANDGSYKKILNLMSKMR